MFRFKITWRVDDSESFEIEDQIFEAYRVSDLSTEIRAIEKDHTIISIINLDTHFYDV